MTDALAKEAEKKVDDTAKQDDTQKAAETDRGKATDAAKGADAGKDGGDKKAAGEAAKGETKEFVADSTKTDAENDAARAEFDKANPKTEEKPDPRGLPDDWREIAAGKDEAALKLAKRYGSMSGVLKALKEAQDTIRSGKLKAPMPDAKDEKAMAEWRKAEGIPDEAAGYKIPETVTKRLTDDDKPMLSSFTEFAHKKGARQDVVDIGTEWYIETMEAIEAKRTETDKADREAAEDALRKDWAHGEYKANTTMAKRWAATIPGLGEEALGIRAPDGRMLGSIPEFVAWAADMGRDKFGDLAFTTSDGERRHTNRKAEIEKIMSTDIDEYRRQGLDKEYAQILEREERRGPTPTGHSARM